MPIDMTLAAFSVLAEQEVLQFEYFISCTAVWAIIVLSKIMCAPFRYKKLQEVLKPLGAQKAF